MAKIGQLFLQQGTWKDEQLISADWVEESTAHQITTDGRSEYGYLWWRRSFELASRTVETFYASGNAVHLCRSVYRSGREFHGAKLQFSRVESAAGDDVEIHIARSELIEAGRQIVLAAQVTCCCEAGVVYGWTALDYAMDRLRK